MVDGMPFTIIKLITQETASFLLNTSLETWPWKFNTSRTVLCRDVMQLVAFENCAHRVWDSAGQCPVHCFDILIWNWHL